MVVLEKNAPVISYARYADYILATARRGPESPPSDQVLLVRAESTTWATVLRQLAPQIVAKLNAELGEGSVVRIEVRGPAAPSWKHGIRSVRDGRGPRDTYG